MISSSLPSDQHNDAIWIGIDFGTSNSTCAVWDSTRGSPKWIRLVDIATTESSGKVGRTVPSILQDNEDEDGSWIVGAQAITSRGPCLRSIKRFLGMRYEEVLELYSSRLFSTAHYFLVEEEENDDKHQDWHWKVANKNKRITPVEGMATILRAIREKSEQYLTKYRTKKHLNIPGISVVQNVVVGVPAHFSKRHIRLVEQACRLAGFRGHVSTCLESTAAAMAYGLTMQESSNENDENKEDIMVIDMGGGTSDITIATKTEKYDGSSYEVVVTQGDAQLGGDDIDHAILEYYLQEHQDASEKSKMASSELRQACRKAKEALCDPETPSSSAIVGSISINIRQFETLLQPWLERARRLIQKALDQHHGNGISEVILVGGTTRVPAIRSMIQSFFPKLELCTSLNPTSSVALGLAIQAALESKLVPLHELKSALMLDCIPHAIGVVLGNGDFCEIIPRNTPLPAKGEATFTLADTRQAGVTIRAVERLQDGVLEALAKEDFTFLLRRLDDTKRQTMKYRNIQVGMKVDTHGQFMVSIFDENDPEQVRKRERFERSSSHAKEAAGELGYIADLVLAESETTVEQMLLVGTLVAIIVLYIGVKVAFNEPGADGSIIL